MSDPVAALYEAIAQAGHVTKSRGFDRFKRTVIRDGKAFKIDAPEPFRTSLKGSSGDLLDAARWSKKTLKRSPRKPAKKD